LQCNCYLILFARRNKSFILAADHLKFLYMNLFGQLGDYILWNTTEAIILQEFLLEIWCICISKNNERVQEKTPQEKAFPSQSTYSRPTPHCNNKLPHPYIILLLVSDRLGINFSLHYLDDSIWAINIERLPHRGWEPIIFWLWWMKFHYETWHWNFQHGKWPWFYWVIFYNVFLGCPC